MEHMEIYTAEWCGTCDIMKTRAAHVALIKRMKLKTINVDENPERAAEMNVKSIPTLLVVSDDEATHRFIGVVGEKELRREI